MGAWGPRRPACRGWLAVGVLCVLVLVATAGAARAEETDEASGGIGGAGAVFVPTHEWQAIPRGAAVPPGLHIRLDLSTGERYAKLIDGVEDSSSSSAAVSTSFKVNRTDGAVVATEPPPEPLEPGEASRRTKEKVLSDLPPAELQAMGVDFAKAKAELPEEDYWALVEATWEQRQAVIQQVYEQMLKPAEELGKIIATISKPANASHDEMREALEKLEDFLTDIDMARDFHTLGGWPHLVRLLDPHHHTEVRWRAAWAVGNAVKNDAEFQLWSLDRVDSGLGGGASALARLVGALAEGEAAVGAGLGQHHPGRDAAPDELLRKAVYAVTSAARGNARVQAGLLQEGGLDALGALLAAPFASTALRVKVATFGVDMLTEAGHGQEHEHLKALRGAVTSPAWCEGSLALLHDVRDNPTHTEKLLLSVEALQAHCKGAGALPAERLHATLTAVKEVYADHQGIHESYREELLGHVERLMGSVRVEL